MADDSGSAMGEGGAPAGSDETGSNGQVSDGEDAATTDDTEQEDLTSAKGEGAGENDGSGGEPSKD